MRIAVVLLFSLFFQVQADVLYSQSAKVSLNMKNATVEDVLNAIEDNSEFHFLYNSKLINVDRKVSINAADKSIESVLSTLFSNYGIEYKIDERQIILSRKDLTTEKLRRTTSLPALL